MPHCSRRSFLAGLAAAAPLGVRAAPLSAEERLDAANKRLAWIEEREGGRLGVAIIDTQTSWTLEHRADERFPMCSTFKLLAAAAALKRVDDGAERLDRVIAYGPGDLLDYAPIAKTHVASGGMTLGDLCAAAIDWSDNTAGNLVLAAIGGPAGASSKPGSSTTKSATRDCVLEFRSHGASATRPAAAITERRTRLESSGRPSGRR
jgi:beta-lactamase class A